MKYLLRVLFVLALFVGFSSHAHAAGVDFHAQVLDPSCNSTTTPTECGIGFTDLGVPFAVSLSAAQCGSTAITPPLTGLPTDGTPFGCFLGTNDTGGPITSITLDFKNIPGVTGCDTTLEGITPGPAFTNTSCNVDPSGGYDLSFSGGPGVADGHVFVILEEGVDPGDFSGTATVAATPEPDSLLLLSTGTMMMGLYLAGRTRLFSFLKK
jgi:hypothetical protein